MPAQLAMQQAHGKQCTHSLVSLHGFYSQQSRAAVPRPALHGGRATQPRRISGVAKQQRHRPHRSRPARCVGDDAGGAGEIEHQAAEDASTADAAAGAAADFTLDSRSGTELRQRTRQLQALEAYQQQMQRDEEDIDVLECALLIARHAHPDLDGTACLAEIDTLAAGVRESLPEAPVPLRVVQAINTHLYHVHGFRGNSQDYYSPDNSCINKVLENRRGIPITLALLYTSIASRCGLPMVGIGLPGRFMLAPAAEDIEVLVDAFKGEIVFLEEAADTLASIHGIQPGRVVIDPKVVRNKAQHAVTPRKFLARLLHNLKQVYVSNGELHNTLAVVRYLRATLPDRASEVRDEGLCMYALERYADAAEALREYLDADPVAADRAEVESMLTRMRRQGLEDMPDSASQPPN